VAHELKNPLTSLRSALETLPLINDRDKQQRLHDIMIEDTNRLNRLITDISRVSRLDVDLAREETLAIDLRMAIRQALRGYVKGDALLGSVLPTKLDTLTRNIDIVLEIPENLPRVQGNVLRLQQVFDNLIDNAVSFSPNGDIVTITCRANNGVVFTFVDDRGPGIPDGKRAAIFERFYSERPGSEAFGTHSGLGLAIAKQIVDALGGKIYAENRVNSDGKVLGARLVVELKCA
jgi:two-component system, OmpR family, sensor histidine kinase ChvG